MSRQLTHTACAGDKTLAECFLLFDLIHRVTTEHATITAITQRVLASFAEDGVCYVELRTTPKVGRPLAQPLCAGSRLQEV